MNKARGTYDLVPGDSPVAGHDTDQNWSDKTHAPPPNNAPSSLWKLIGYNLTLDNIWFVNMCTAGVHALNALVIVLVAFLSTAKSYPDSDPPGPYLPSVCFDPGTNGTDTNGTETQSGRGTFKIVPEIFTEARAYLLVLVVLFFLLSCGFQFVPAIWKHAYKERVRTNAVNTYRYVEYSLSASFMMVAIACSLLVYDFYTHILVFTCTMLCMMLGLVADHVRVLSISFKNIFADSGGGVKGEGPAAWENATEAQRALQKVMDNCLWEATLLKWFAHALGWVAMMSPYLFVFTVSYVRSVAGLWECSVSDASDDPMPPVVHAIVIIQFIMFSAFGVVQILQFTATDPHEAVGKRTEFRFIMLSLTCKSLLGWLIAFNAFIV